MRGLMMDYPLTLPPLLERAQSLYGYREIITRPPDKSIHRYTMAEFVERAKRLAVALNTLGVEPGDRVGTLAWNHYQHLEARLAHTQTSGFWRRAGAVVPQDV